MKRIQKINRLVISGLLLIVTGFSSLSYAQANSGLIKDRLIAIGYDNIQFKKPFEVFEITELNSSEIKLPKKNDWAMRCKGYLKAPISGEITFYVEADNYIRVELNGQNVFETSNTELANSFQYEFKQEQDYPIEIFYVHDSGPATLLKFYWSWQGKEKSLIPASALSYNASDRITLENILAKDTSSNLNTYLNISNPDPAHLPTLTVWQKYEQMLVGASFPNVPNFACDLWCYESQVELVDMIALDRGRLKLYHKINSYPFLYLATLITPEPGALDVCAWIEKSRHAKEAIPQEVIIPNICWQLKRAPNFASQPDNYLEFVNRCFIITKEGMTFLNKTDRKKIPVRNEDDQVNNPPWVQIYLKEGEETPSYNPNNWSGCSDTRFTRSIIGAVSKDGKYLAAIANHSATTMCQAWHDCMHNNPQWLPLDASPGDRIWKLKIYVMENDVEKLIERVDADFPPNQFLKLEEIEKIKKEAEYGVQYQTVGSVQNLPVFLKNAKERLIYPMSWLSGRFKNFAEWKKQGKEIFRSTWMNLPNEVPFHPVLIDEEDRGSYLAQKVVLNITEDSRILSYLLKPKSKGPFPAVLLLHDHGARFDIGKEKVIQPFHVDEAILKSSEEWANILYDGRIIGEELARRGYVCFATDAFHWGDRGGGGRMAQQAIASNLFNLGMSFAGLIAFEDLRSAKFLASLDFVDKNRIAAMGLSMGAFRTWQVTAMSDEIQAGVAICWMATNHGLMTYFNNQTEGHSSFALCHPGLFRYLDYPDVASLACPKPMLFYNGEKDHLFPIAAVEEAFAKMKRVWKSQDAEANLITQIWPVPHVFTKQMQDEAFKWLDNIFQK
jgi:dienelactone hydrolase